MRLGRVIGNVVSTVQHPDFEARKLLLVQPVDVQGVPVDQSVLALDGGSQAGIGDYVLLVQEGKGARQLLISETAPCEAVIAGVIDHLTAGGEQSVLRPPVEEGEDDG